jgi:DNA invertase Pin-like site-specific DNA recombinase
MLIGYARTSTAEQEAGLAAQERDLRAVGCERVFSERVSSVSPTRPQLAAALDFVREGDKLVVTRLDRLARSMANLLEIAERLKAKGVALQVLDPAMDTASATGELVFLMFGALAQFERRLMLERQREGIAKAKAEGKYKGRAPTARNKADEIMRLRAEGVRPTDIARKLGISRLSVYRVAAEVEAGRQASASTAAS